MGPCNQILVGGETDKGVVLVLVLIQFTESHCHSDVSTVWSNHASFNMDQVGWLKHDFNSMYETENKGFNILDGMPVISRYNSTTGLFVFFMYETCKSNVRM